MDQTGNGPRLGDMLERAYGSYPGPAMREIVNNHYRSYGDDQLLNLYRYIIKQHESHGSPPVLSTIMVMAYRLPYHGPLRKVAIEEEKDVSPAEGIKRLRELLDNLCKKKP